MNLHHRPSLHRVAFVLIMLALLSVACGPTTATQVASVAATRAATFTPSLSPTTTFTTAPSATHTSVPTNTPQPSATAAPTATHTSVPTNTPQPSATAAPTATHTAVPTSTQTSAPTAGPVEVDFIDVGQGDAILVRTSEGQVALIDGGEQGSGVLAYLSGKGVTHIDLMVATHPHADHIGGLVDVLGAISVERVVTNGQPHTTQVYERFLDGILSAEAEYIEARRGDTLPLGNLSFQVLSPVSLAGDDLNNSSLVLRLVVGQVTFLFTGDAQADAEAGMIGSGLPLQADVLKAGHHGSHTSSSAAFLAQVHPSVAIYMAGAGNSYGHPHAEAIAALSATGAQIFGTDNHGTITVTTDGKTFQVSPAQNGPRATPVVEATEPPAESGPLSVEIVSVTSPIARGAYATLQARSAPGANCGIMVYYKSGPSEAGGLEPKTADDNGNLSWSWKVGTRTTPGNWRIVVTCSQAGESFTQETTFEVTQ